LEDEKRLAIRDEVTNKGDRTAERLMKKVKERINVKDNVTWIPFCQRRQNGYFSQF
jgi:hypothetical protein